MEESLQAQSPPTRVRRKHQENRGIFIVPLSVRTRKSCRFFCRLKTDAAQEHRRKSPVEIIIDLCAVDGSSESDLPSHRPRSEEIDRSFFGRFRTWKENVEIEREPAGDALRVCILIGDKCQGDACGEFNRGEH